jgi:myo-inositol-1(or 4)-monophosphatase
MEDASSSIETDLLLLGTQIAKSAAALARSNGLATLRGPRSDEQDKGAADLVTEMDRKMERELRLLLDQSLPGADFAGEESSSKPVAAIAGNRWVVDPIDGTVNFSRGIPPFTSTILLEHDGQPKLGIVVDPIAESAVLAVAGAGCHRLDVGVALGNEPLERLQVRTRDISHTVVAVMLGPTQEVQLRRHTLDLIEQILHATLGVRVYVSQAFEAKSLAEGSLDAVVTLRSSSGWTRGAAKLLCREAGGLVGEVIPQEEGKPPGFVLAATPELREVLADSVAEVGFHLAPS